MNTKAKKSDAHWLALPNLLTYGRIVAIPLLVLCFFMEGKLQSSDLARWSALGIFVLASITDYFDGYFARAWQQTSTMLHATFKFGFVQV